MGNLTKTFLIAVLLLSILNIQVAQADLNHVWLSDWENRLPLILNSTEVSAPLTDFPLLLHLSSSCGENSYDAEHVFIEIQNNYNRTAYATSEGTQLYFEVEYWNYTEPEAYVWVKTPTISNTTDTTIYFYYDITKDGAAYHSPQDVWMNQYMGVWHMNDNSTTTILDSTSNSNNGVKTGANEPVEASAQIGFGQDYDNDNDLITVSDDSSLENDPFSLSFWVNPESTGEGNRIVMQKDATAGFYIYIYANTWHIAVGNDYIANRPAVSYNTWQHLAFTFDGTDGQWSKNSVASTADTLATPSYSTGALTFGNDPAGAHTFNGLIDEIQVYNGTFTTTWIKVTYETQNDSFITIELREEYSTKGFVLSVALISMLLFIPAFALIWKRRK